MLIKNKETMTEIATDDKDAIERYKRYPDKFDVVDNKKNKSSKNDNKKNE